MGLIPVLPTNVEILIIGTAVAYTVVSIAAQRLLSNPKRMREIQTEVKDLQKELNAMLKNNAAQEDLMKKQKELMPLLGEQMKQSMKPMLVVFPLLIIVYYLLIPHIPIIAHNDVNGSKTLFFIVVFVLGIISAIGILIYDRIKGKQEAATKTDTIPQNSNEETQNNQ